MKRINFSNTAKFVGLGAIVAAGFAVTNSATAELSTSNVAYTTKGVPFVKGELLVKARSHSSLEKFVDNNRSALGAFAERAPLHEMEGGNWYKIKYDGDVASDAAFQRALESEGILLAEPNYIYSINMGPNPKPTQPPGSGGKGGPDYAPTPALPDPAQADPRMNELYGLNKIEAEAAWKITKGNSNIILSDIDTGADYNHQDLINNMWRNSKEVAGDGIDNDNNGFIDDVVGWDFRDKDARPYDDNKHGSHTAGTIAATGGNGVGISGVAQKASVMVLRFLGGSQGSGTSEDAIECIRYSTKMGATISSNSWGGGGFSQALFDVISEANDKGVLFVAAAGNSSENNDKNPSYPASYKLPNIISVAATDNNDGMASFSNYGLKSVHVGAPGVKILSSIPGNAYGAFSGTSMAAPHVAGAAYLIKSAYPKLTMLELKGLIIDSVEKVNSLEGKTMTGGRINVAKALKLAQEKFGAPNLY
jgi:subtilisin family serine protease